MATAVHLCFEAYARLAANIKCAYALGTIGFMRCQTHQVNRQSREININPTSSLRSIDVENDAFFTAQGANGGNVLNHTNFIVDEHHADQNRVRPNRILERFKIQQTIGLHVQIGRIKTLTLQLTKGVEHCFMLGLHGDDVLAFRFIKLRCTLDRQIV